MGQKITSFVANVREAAHELGSLVIDTAVEAGKRIPVAVVNEGEFLSLVRHIRPRLIYLNEQTFDPDALFEDDEIGEFPKAKALAKGWRRWNGQVARVYAFVVADGVLHGLQIDADWYGPVEEAADALVKELGGGENIDVDMTARAAADRKIIESKAALLVKDARFAMPKATKAKKQLLAETLFPDVEHRLLWAIVDRADALVWLDTASR